MNPSVTIRPLSPGEIRTALDLIWEVFLQFEAPGYPAEGVETFRTYLNDTEKIRDLRFYGAFDEDVLVGTICVRAPQHIGGFFVRADHHRQGIGRALFERMAADHAEPCFTVNSSPYAVEVYRHLGFVPASEEQLEDGIRFTPMVYGAP